MRFRSSVAGALLGGMLVFVCGAIYAQNAPQIVPRVTGAAALMGDMPAPAGAADHRRQAADAQLSGAAADHSALHRELSAHAQDQSLPRSSPVHRRLGRADDQRHPLHGPRNGQVLADVTPRRYFCTACHVQQTDAQPLVPSTFKDMLLVGPEKK